MSNVFHFEYRRLFRKLSFYICLGIMLMMVMYGLFTIGLTFMDSDMTGSYKVSAYQLVSYSISFSNLPMMLAIFTAIFVCEDRMRGTVKTIYSLGYPRTQLFVAKYTASLTATMIMTVASIALAILTAFILGADFAPEPTNDGDIFSFMTQNTVNVFLYGLYQITSAMALHSLYFMLSELIGRTGFSIVANIFTPTVVLAALAFGYSFIMGIAMALELDDKIMEFLGNIALTVLMYWLPTFITSLILSFGGLMDDSSCIIGCFVNIGYVVLFGGLALLVTVKKQIK